MFTKTPAVCKQSLWVRAIHRVGRYILKLFRLPEPQPGGSKPVIAPLANPGEEHFVALLHFTTLTSSALAPRHNHVWYYCQTRDHPRRMCRLCNFASEFCWRRPPYKQDRSPAHHCNTGLQATYRCDDCYSEGTTVRNTCRPTDTNLQRAVPGRRLRGF